MYCYSGAKLGIIFEISKRFTNFFLIPYYIRAYTYHYIIIYYFVKKSENFHFYSNFFTKKFGSFDILC